MLNIIEGYITALNALVWDWYMLLAILATGLYLTIRIAAKSLLAIPLAWSLLFQKHSSREGDISHFQALMTSMSATIGTGNIAGVATAVFLGGPGALFWMWCTALVGMATKYAEAVLAVRYREKDEKGHYIGGPMYYIKNGLGASWVWLGIVFAVFASLAGFGIGNGVQANSVADVMQSSFSVPPYITGLVLAIGVALVLLGGVQRIAQVAGFLVPIMGVVYVAAAMLALLLNATEIPAALVLIVRSAFEPLAVGGGLAGAAFWAAIRYGVARGIFSNEAGMGSAPIAHAAAKTDSPVEQGLIAMLGTFIDTLVICTMTGLVILTTGALDSGLTGASLSSKAFELGFPAGNYLVSICLALFAFSTILGWSYYSERCLQYLFGLKVIMPFRCLWVAAVFCGALLKLEFVWLLADTLNALMALPNLLALLLLSPVVASMTRDYFSNRKHGSSPTGSTET